MVIVHYTQSYTQFIEANCPKYSLQFVFLQLNVEKYGEHLKDLQLNRMI